MERPAIAYSRRAEYALALTRLPARSRTLAQNSAAGRTAREVENLRWRRARARNSTGLFSFQPYQRPRAELFREKGRCRQPTRCARTNRSADSHRHAVMDRRIVSGATNALGVEDALRNALENRSAEFKCGAEGRPRTVATESGENAKLAANDACYTNVITILSYWRLLAKSNIQLVQSGTTFLYERCNFITHQSFQQIRK